MAFEKVEVPRGAYIGWGGESAAGKQHITGRVLDYDPTGSTDFAGKECPLLEIELTERAVSFNKKGEHTNYLAGEVVCLSCGQVSLKRAVKKADLRAGYLVKITFDAVVQVDKGTVKEFGIMVDRNVKVDESPSAEKDSKTDDDEPPW